MADLREKRETLFEILQRLAYETVKYFEACINLLIVFQRFFNGFFITASYG